MEVLYLLIPLSVALAFLIGAAFWWAVASGQFDDLEGPAHRILLDDDGWPAQPDPGAAPTRAPAIDLNQRRERTAPLPSPRAPPRAARAPGDANGPREPSG